MSRFYAAAAAEEGPPDPEEAVTVTVTSTENLVTGAIAGPQGATSKDWHGRAFWITRPDGVKILFWRDGTAHNVNDGALHLRFFRPSDATWSLTDKTLAGASVTNFPMNPSTLTAGEDAGEPYALYAPNGDLIVYMWRSDYGVTSNGTWMARSTDDGETWGASAGPIEFAFATATLATHKRTYMTDDGFVRSGVTYAGARIYTSTALIASNFCLMKNTTSDLDIDSWERVSIIMAASEGGGRGSIEASLEQIGSTGMEAMLRDGFATHSYRRTSTDLGVTWGTLTDVTGVVGIAGRQRVYSVDRLLGNADPEDDPRRIMVGFNLQDPGNSQQRRRALWITLDSGTTWSAPFYLAATTADGGYGDITYDPVATEFLVASYEGTLTAATLTLDHVDITGLGI